MTHAIYAVLVALLGFGFLAYVNWLVLDTFTNYHQTSIEAMSPRLISTPKIFKISVLIIGLVGIFFGIKGRKINKNISILGILLAALVCIFKFVHVWYFFV